MASLALGGLKALGASLLPQLSASLFNGLQSVGTGVGSALIGGFANKIGDLALRLGDKIGIYDYPKKQTEKKSFADSSSTNNNIGQMTTLNDRKIFGQNGSSQQKRFQQSKNIRTHLPYNRSSIYDENTSTSDIFQNPRRSFGNESLNKLNFGRVRNTQPDYQINKRPYNQTIRGFSKDSFNDLQQQKKIKFDFNVDKYQKNQPQFGNNLGLKNYQQQSFVRDNYNEQYENSNIDLEDE